MGCFTECSRHCLRLAFLIVVVYYFISSLTSVLELYKNRKLVQVDFRQQGEGRSEVDITLCPWPAVNYTRLLEVGSTYRALVRRLEGELFDNMTEPVGVGDMFGQMNSCLRHSQVMKDTEDLLDRIDAALPAGCVPERAHQLAERHNMTTQQLLRQLVLEHSYRLLAAHFDRKDRFRFYYSDKTFQGIEYLKWDNLTVLDFLDMIAIKPAEIVKLRPRRTGNWSVKTVHTRHAPSCVRYRVHPQPGEGYFKAMLDIDSSVCQQSLSEAAHRWRRDFCHAEASVGLMLHASAAGGYRAMGVLYQRPPLWLPVDRSSVVELNAFKKRKRDTLCNDSGRKHQITFRQCLRSCLIDSAVGQIDCMFPWLQSADDDNDTSRMSYCSTYASAAKAMEISDGLLDNPKQSDCLEQCAYDCSELDVDVTLAGLVKQPDADSQRTITITLRGDMDHTTTAMVELPNLEQSLTALMSIAAFMYGVSLLSFARWLLQLMLWVGCARRYLAALPPVCVADLYLGRALRRLRVAHRWLWRPRPERPWLRPIGDRPRSTRLWQSLVSWVRPVDPTASGRTCWSSMLVELDTDSESDAASVRDSTDAVDLHGRLSRARAAALECLRGGCGQAAEKQVLKEIEAELAMEEELEHMAEIVSSGGLAGQPRHHSSMPRHSVYSHSRAPGGAHHGSRALSMMSSDGRHSGGRMLLSALGGVSANASRYSAAGRHSHGHRKSSVVSQVSGRRSLAQRPSYVPPTDGQPPAPPRHGSPDRHSSHDHRQRARASLHDVGRGHRSSYFDMGGGHRPSSYSMGSGNRSSYSTGTGHDRSVREMHGGIPSFHEDIRAHMSSLITDVRSRMHPFPEDMRGRRPSAYHEERGSPGAQRHSPHEEGRRSSPHRQPSHYEDGRDRRPPHHDDLEHGRRSSHYEEAYGRRSSHYEGAYGRRSSHYDEDRGLKPSHHEDGLRPSYHEDGRRPSFYDDGRRPSAIRGRGPGRGRGRGRAGRGRGRGRGSGRGTRPSVAPSDGMEEHQ